MFQFSSGQSYLFFLRVKFLFFLIYSFCFILFIYFGRALGGRLLIPCERVPCLASDSV